MSPLRELSKTGRYDNFGISSFKMQSRPFKTRGETNENKKSVKSQ